MKWSAVILGAVKGVCSNKFENHCTSGKHSTRAYVFALN